MLRVKENSARYLRVNQGEREVIETREKRVKRALERRCVMLRVKENSARYLRVNQGEREVIETREKRVKRALERLKRPMAGATENKDIN
ncbi:hypothetical protein NDU88_004364 [Pleurodeles waltl]|uniref:Uncharacterized protein n=1 Tax=Pleurodeles waltl TaxID=8319 RepID=A0AAV7L181_PLEWA|nr:hypothetical protein NDU88_004364 [Pleurodeles waltl]